jgi:CHAT domain-containing protein
MMTQPRLIATVALLGMVLAAPQLLALQQDTSRAASRESTPTQTPAELPAPQPSAGVRKLLEEGSQLGQSRQFAEAVKAGDRALAAAREARDAAGEAWAHRLRARALEDLGQAGEAAEAWRETAAAWERMGNGPEQILALAGAARLLPVEKAGEADALIARAVAVGRAETQRPRAAAQAFSSAGRDAYQRRRLGQAATLLRATLSLREKLSPESPDVAASLNNLGIVVREQGNLAAARAYHERALAIHQKVAPDSPDMAASLNNLGIVAREQGDLTAARQYYERSLALRQMQAPNSIEVSMSLHNLGNVAADQGDLAGAREYYDRALAIQKERAPDSLYVAGSLNGLGNVAKDRGELARAREYYVQALAIQQKVAPDSLEAATSLHNLGNVASEEGNLAGARAYYDRALAIRQKRSPASLDTGASLMGLGDVAVGQGDLVQARGYYERSLAIQQKVVPDSLDVARSLTGLGNVAGEQGDLAKAREYHQRSLAIKEQRTPGSPNVATSLHNVGNVAMDQGDLAGAREFFDRALTITQKLAPDSTAVAVTLNSLGNVARHQGDLTGAIEYYRRSLTIYEHFAPGSLAVAVNLSNLGDIAREQEDLPAAREYHTRALAIKEKLAPGSLAVAASLGSLGILAGHQGELGRAREYHERALAIQQKLAPDSLEVAGDLGNLGNIAYRQGDLVVAREHYQRALAIQQGLAPDSLEAALSLSNLGRVAGKQGDWGGAERQFLQAWQIVRRQAGSVTGDEARQAFGSATATYAASLLQAQLALGHSAPAFLTLEESRAQALQQLLLERRLLLGTAAGPLAAPYQEAVAARDRAEALLSGASTQLALVERQLGAIPSRTSAQAQQLPRADRDKADQELRAAQSAYTQARLLVEARWAAIKRANPRALTPPLTAQQALQALSPGTLHVAFLVGQEQVYLLLLRPGPLPRSLAAYTLAVKAEALEMMVARLRGQMLAAIPNRATTTRASRALFAALFPPAARSAVLSARRLLVSPDGFLWQVPFAALVTSSQEPPRYLGAGTPITCTPSLTLFAQVRRDPSHLTRGQRPAALIVGNPRFAPRPAPRSPGKLLASVTPPPTRQGEMGEVLRDGGVPAALPRAAEEAAAIARLYGTEFLTDAAATEAVVRARAGNADIIHLATHGLLATHRAMSSGVLLAAPEGEAGAAQTANDGLLQAWEIYSQLPLKAELVVLSACETGLGEHVRSEGIVGLTRALQAAGARSVVASQWRVADVSTERLMVAFHRKLREGVAKDEALRQAMAVVRGDPATADPRYWAAFFLVGDPANPNLGVANPRASRKRRGS